MKPSEKPIDRVDQFFKNKLEDHTVAPSENAWAKVEAGFSKKNNVVLWRWAAAILLAGALITIIYQSRKENNQPVLAEKNLSAGKAGIEKEKSTTSTETKKSGAEQSAGKVVREDTNHGYRNSIQEEMRSQEKMKLIEIEKELAQQYTIKVPFKDVTEEKTNTEATPKTEVASTKQKPIKLEFTLEDLPSEEKVATTNEVKSSGIKKVLQLARDMKQGEGPMSGLREKKDELLAHNFITGKERNQ